MNPFFRLGAVHRRRSILVSGSNIASALALLVLTASAVLPQSTTGVITGVAEDVTGALIPGAEVTISSPSMIGERTAFTDERGIYRFTQLVPGTYRVSFVLPGFRTLNIEGVEVAVGAAMTIDGAMDVASLDEMITVTSTVSAIDLEAATVGVNWGQQNLEKIPYGKSLPSFVSVIPGLYATQYDVGASTMGGTAAPPARAYGRNGGNMTTYDGVVWDQTFGDFGSYEEVQVTSAAKGAEVMNPGASFNFVVKSGGNDFHGSLMGAWQDDSFQSNNVSQKLLDRGLEPTGNQYTRYNDFKGDLGGPIKRDKLWFYSSYTDSYSGQYISGFVSDRTGQPEVFSTRLYGLTVKLTYQPSEKTRIEIVDQLMRKWQPYRDADQFHTLESTRSQTFWGSIGPRVNWTYFASSNMTVDASVSRAGFWNTYGGTKWTDQVRRVDRTTGQTRGAALHTVSRPARLQWSGNWSWFTHLGDRSHEIKSGVMGWYDKNFSERLGYPNQQLYRYRSLAADGEDYFLRPDSVQVFDSPNNTADIENYKSWFLNDKIQLTRNLTINAGVRFDRYSSKLPEQGNPGTGPFAIENLYPERDDFPVYNSWVPRLSAVYDMFGSGKFVLKASYGRYAAGGSGTNSTPAPSAGRVNPAAAVTRTYNNWDGTIPYVPIEADLASVSGGGGIQRLDSNLDLPYMDEYTAGVEVGLDRDNVIRFNVVRKMDSGGSKTLNLALPYSAYTDVRYGVDPGRDNIAGTDDDSTLEVWSVPRSYIDFGQIDTLITNVGGDEGKDIYTAYEVTFNKRYSNRWSLLASYNADFAKITDSIPQTPNQALYNWQDPEWHYGVKISGNYDLPWGIAYSTAYRAQSGEYFPRIVQVRDALNSLVNVEAEGQVGRYDWVKLWDSRLTKTFQVSENHVVEAAVDIYNMLNSSVVLSQVNTNGPDYLKPTVGTSSAATATAIVPPRIFRLTATWRF